MTATVNAPRAATARTTASPATGRARDARPELRVVGRPATRRPAGLVGAIALVAVFGALFLNAVFHSVLVTDQVRLDRLNQKVAQAQADNQQRRLQVAGLESPARIVQAARDEGMVVPEKTNWVMPRTASGATLSSTTSRASSTPTTDPTDPTDPTDERAAGAAPGSADSVPAGR